MYFNKDTREYATNKSNQQRGPNRLPPPNSNYQYTATAGPESGVFLGV